ncbi:hypothetical protein GCM10009678_85930 [Actinomadura kijaniata]|uniref:AraC-like DNA-binding protein n=1 Tax=Actinomadura namibiensis TaxID=182080 RepID=A0A7W3QJY4_ACTNM|nr:AraC family transcriptional regulator [Actinomadura namibiensis]MBA8949423.1 AraC-like DNA-binding protein [Actinomadura namibiensis]
MIVQPAGAPGLERTGRRLRASGPVTVFAEDGPAAVTRHAHPAWKLVLCASGHVEIDGRGRAPGVLVPPRLPHTAATTGPYTAVFLDPWQISRPYAPLPLDERTTRRLLAADPPDLAAALGRPAVLDPRLAHALDHLAHAARLEDLAAEVGLSAHRLRALTRSAVGVPLARLRQWARLRVAVTALADVPPADAAHLAGLADQPHLTRLSRGLLGRTPRSLVSAPPARR